MPGFMFDLPLVLSGILLLLVFSGISLLGTFLIRRHVMSKLVVGPEDVLSTATMVTSVMVFYGLIVALIAVNVWERYNRVSEVVAEEATAVASLWRDFAGYPEADRLAMEDLLRGYVEQTIRVAWPLQRRGEIPSAGVGWMDQLQQKLFAFQPANSSQSALHTETLAAYNRMIVARRLRLDSVHVALPGLVWMLIFSGALVCILVALLLKVEDGRLQAGLMLIFSVFVAMVVFIVLAFDRPFRGDLRITAEPLQLIYEQLMHGR